MNKILNINLGGYALTIDDDAYQYLTAYFDSLRNRFKESEGRDEILHDIETRMGEIISSNLGGGRSIVMLHDVESAVKVMGKPEDFGGEPVETPKAGKTADATGTGSSSDKSSSSSDGSGWTSKIKTGKRLFRDNEEKVIGGVCSGVAAYFGIQDPVWVRIGFVLLGVLSGGFWTSVYGLLWIIIPPAKTAADRLAMRGEQIDIDSIAKEIENAAQRLSKKFNELNDEGEVGRQTREHAKAFGTGVVYVLGKAGIGLLILIAILMILGLGTTWVTGIVALSTAAPYLDYISPVSQNLTYLGLFNIFCLFGLPVIGLCVWVVRTITKVQTPRWISVGSSVLWTLNLFSLIFILASGASKLRERSEVNREVDLSSLSSDTLRVEAIANTPEGNISFGNLRVSDGKISFSDIVEVRVVPSKSGRIECSQVISARGSSYADALDNASISGFDLQQVGNTLRVPIQVAIEEGKKWRVQQIRINIGLPVGKSVIFDEKIYRNAAADMKYYADKNRRNYISRKPERTFKMTADGLLCTGCIADYEKGSDDDNEEYENFVFEGNFKVELRKGDNFKFRIDGPEKGNIEVIESGEKITLTTNGKSAANTTVYMDAKVFTTLFADNTGQVNIRGFEEGRADISAKGDSRIKAYLDASSELNVSLSGQSTLELNGRGGTLNANLNDNAILEASGWRANDGNITANDNSRARVNIEDEVDLKGDARSNIKVEGRGGN
jgi:phage shock protein PspC (stress-responsive transcriptional regulator)